MEWDFVFEKITSIKGEVAINEENVAHKITNVASNHLEVAQQRPNVAYSRKVAPNEENVAQKSPMSRVTTWKLHNSLRTLRIPKHHVPSPLLLLMLYKIPFRTRPIGYQIHIIQHTRSTIFRIYHTEYTKLFISNFFINYPKVISYS